MIRINLLPVRVSKKKAAGKNQLMIFLAFVALAVVLNAYWHASRANEAAQRDEKIKRTREEIAQLEKIIGEVKNIKAQQAAVKDKLAVLEKLKAGRQGPVHVLDELAGIVPKRLWFRKVDEAGGAIAFDGSGGTIDDVSSFLTALKKSVYFSNVELRKTHARRDAKFKLVDFTITANVNYTPSVQPVATAATPPKP